MARAVFRLQDLSDSLGRSPKARTVEDILGSSGLVVLSTNLWRGFTTRNNRILPAVLSYTNQGRDIKIIGRRIVEGTKLCELEDGQYAFTASHIHHLGLWAETASLFERSHKAGLFVSGLIRHPLDEGDFKFLSVGLNTGYLQLHYAPYTKLRS